MAIGTDRGTAPAIVIIGGGQAGGSAAQALRRAGFAGPVTIVGDEAHPPYERPPLSKDVLLGRMDPDQALLCSFEHWAEIEVALELGVAATAIDRASRRVVLADGRTLPYDRLIIATGIRPRRLDVPGAADPRIHYLRTIDDAERLKAALRPGSRVIGIGAGFIGLEVAASARSLGCAVTIVEAAARPLGRLLPAGFADWIAALHRAEDVEIRCGSGVAAFVPNAQEIEVRLTDGGVLSGDVVIVGIGCLPNSEIAAAAGLAVRDGIATDGECRSSDPDIFAIGDVAHQIDPLTGAAGRLESWRNALDQAAKVAAIICGRAPAAPEARWFWTDQYGRNIQIAGIPADGMAVVERGAPDQPGYMAFYLDGAVIRGAVGVDCGRDIRIARGLIRAGAAVDPQSLADPAIRLPRP